MIAGFSSGVVDPTPMIGPTLALNRIGDAFDMVRDAEVHGGALVTPNAIE